MVHQNERLTNNCTYFALPIAEKTNEATQQRRQSCDVIRVRPNTGPTKIHGADCRV